MKAPLSYVPVLPAATGIVSGILLYHLGYFAIPLFLCLVAFFALYAARYHYASFFAIMTGIGLMLAYTMRPPELSPSLFQAKYKYTGYVEQANARYTSLSYDVHVTHIDNTEVTPFDCMVSVISVEETAIPGSKVSFTAKLKPLDSAPVIPYDFDYNKCLRLNGLSAKCTVDQFNAIAPASALDRKINDIRDGIYNAIVESHISPQLASFMVAIILGDDTLLSSDDLERFRATGIAHILALSGLHVGILASLLSILLLPVQATRYGRYIKSVVTLCAIWLYVIIVGFTPSILRAAIMLSTYLVARLIQRGSNGYNSLLLSIVIILAITPNALFTPGFQLSVAAVASILMFGTVFSRGLQRHPVIKHIVELLTVPIAAMLGTGLVSIYYFNLMPGMFLFGNIIAGILLPWILGGGIVLMAMTSMGLSFRLLGSLLDAMYSLMNHAVEWLATLRIAIIDDIFISGWVLLPYSITLVVLAFALHYRKRYQWMSTIVLLMITGLTVTLTRTTHPEHEMYIVGNSQSTQIVMRTGNTAYTLTTIAHASRRQEDAEMNKAHHRFLANRNCGNSFERVTDTLSKGPFSVTGNLLTFGDRVLAIANSDSLRAERRSHNYVLLSGNYQGKITDIIGIYHPDTILLGTDIQPQRRIRIIREMSDSIPYIDLRERQIAVVWAK